MRRREFITLLGGATVWPLAARAQQIQGMRRVAMLTAFAETEAEVQRWFAAFVHELRDLGWIEGSNIRIDMNWNWATTDVSRLNRATMELIESKPDVILANGPLPLAALRQMTTRFRLSSRALPIRSGLASLPASPNPAATSRVSRWASSP